MSIALSPDHLALTSTHPLRVALVSLLTDPAGPLAESRAPGVLVRVATRIRSTP